jgi:acyl-CoA synthetase (AMP-forming)/AMP-acid ligase II
MDRDKAIGKKEILLHVLEDRALREPGKPAFIFHSEPATTYGALWRGISGFAQDLLCRGLQRNQLVLIALPNSRRFFSAFYGVQLAGGIAVPVFPGSGIPRLLKLAGLCRAAAIVISRSYDEARKEEMRRGAESAGRRLIVAEEVPRSFRKIRFPEIQPGDVAMVQFTSGSSGEPKGVRLSQANLVVNLRQMVSGMAITRRDRFVSWLPVYHDMGLILMSMVPFYLGIPLTVLPSGFNYLNTWLRTIEEQRATFTAAPDFAYRMCLRTARNPENFNLSSLRVALNAAEPVRFSTIQRFEERFRLNNVMTPAYGLAESTVGVCSFKPGKKVKVDRRGFVSVGRPFPGVEMRILKNGSPAGTGDIGEIRVKSGANTGGYYGNPRATRALFDKEGFIKTGDLGYVDAEGDYYVVGRKKNIIIQEGINISSREVEEFVDAFPYVRRSAAVGIDRGGPEGEQAYLFLEMNWSRAQQEKAEAGEEFIIDVVERFNNIFGFKPGRVYLLKPRSIPMTFNGKIRYSHLKRIFRDGSLRASGRIIFPAY